MKMTRAQKKRRKLAKVVEMKLDGVKLLWGWRGMSYEELCQHHEHEKYLNRDRQYWGTSLSSMVLNEAGERMRREIDKQLLKEYMNGHAKQPN